MEREYIVVHHSLTKDSGTVSWSAIRRFHVQTNGWSAIGYNYGLELVGTRVEGLIGRSIREPGAHTKEAGMNRKSIGVCVVGNFDLDAPPDNIWLATVSLVRDLMVMNHIPPAKVIGHREAGLMAGFDWKKGQFKSCPGKLWNMDDFRGALA